MQNDLQPSSTKPQGLVACAQIVAQQPDAADGEEQLESPAKKHKKSSSAKQENKKKAHAADAKLATVTAPARTSSIIDQAKHICKQATVKIPPSTYAKSKSLAEVEADLEALLEKHGLSLDSSSQYIEKVRRR